MSARDELAGILHGKGAYCGSCGYEDGECADCTDVLSGYADAILAAGYRRPRTITTAEELGALPNGSLLLSGDRIRMYSGAVWRVKSGGMIERVGKELDGVTPFRYFVDPLPATVLHEPEATP